MKKINRFTYIIKKSYILATIFTACLFTGCMDNLLDTEPKDSIASSNMWTTEATTDQGIAGIYAVLRDGVTAQWGDQLYEYDRFGFSGQAREISWKGMDDLLTGSATTYYNQFSRLWLNMYTGVYRANDAIANIPLKSPVSDEKKGRLVAEAKFLRAYYYFRLNQLIKGVPIYLEPTPAEEFNKPRETEEKTWEVIIADLTDAINEPSLPGKYDSSSSSFGHATKGAAYALRGKAYLYMKKYNEAVADFNQVESLGYSLFQGGYKQLFKEANEQCSEMIFSIQNISLSGYGYDTQRWLGQPSGRGEGWNTYMPTPDVVELYEWKDGKKFNWDDVIPGFNEMDPISLREVYFLRDIDGLKEKLIAEGADEGTAETTSAAIINMVNARLQALDNIKPGTSSLYLPKGNEERIRKAYENRDPRLEYNIITPYSSYLGSVNGADNLVVMRWPYYNYLAPARDLRTDTRNWLMYLYRKFVYEGTNEIVDEFRCPTDFPIIRFADVLLMKAEALYELGKENEAREALNQVRSRSSVDMPPITVGGTALRDAIRDERRREFVIEGINYFDELRWGTLKEKAFYEASGNEESAGIKQVWRSNVANFRWQGDYSYTWAIPQAEIEKNPNLVQNPGWR